MKADVLFMAFTKAEMMVGGKGFNEKFNDNMTK
jgi:hypothetical protein